MDHAPTPNYTINSLKMQNFMTFSDAELRFKNLNVIIGENGLGKSNLLKLLYSIMASSKPPHGKTIDEPDDDMNRSDARGDRPTKSEMEKRLSNKLFAVFRPEKRVGRLVSRRQGQNQCSINVKLNDAMKSISFNFNTNMSNISITHIPSAWYADTPVFLPTHELLSVYSGFTWLYEQYKLPFDETLYDTCKLLGAPTLKGRRKTETAKLSKPLEDILGGSIVFDGRRFYLRQQGKKWEMPLVAEGLRKVGMLAQLVNTGQLSHSSCMFWDEPESNLNPKIIREIANTIFGISQSGTQIFVATHSIFLMKELEILARNSRTAPQRYFALESVKDGAAVHQSDDIHEI